MTNSAALVATLQTAVPAGSVSKALADRGIGEGDTYTSTLTESIDRAAIDILWGMLSMPDISEGGYSVRYDRTAIKARLLFLAGKYGVTEITAGLQPTISSPSVW